jgi:hypothetical protein
MNVLDVDGASQVNHDPRPLVCPGSGSARSLLEHASGVAIDNAVGKVALTLRCGGLLRWSAKGQVGGPWSSPNAVNCELRVVTTALDETLEALGLACLDRKLPAFLAERADTHAIFASLLQSEVVVDHLFPRPYCCHALGMAR